MVTIETRCTCGHHCLAHAKDDGHCFVQDCPCTACVHTESDA